MSSLPSRERGLKSLIPNDDTHLYHVAPFTGAWIEITLPDELAQDPEVAPFTGAWIEIRHQSIQAWSTLSRSLHGSVD